MRKLGFFSLALAMALLLTGCTNYGMYPYSDEAYVAAATRDDLRKVRAMLQLDDDNAREVALRALAAKAVLAQEHGDQTAALSLANEIAEHETKERAPRVRAILIGVALPAAGQATPEVCAVLRASIAEGTYAIEACQALASLDAPQAYECIEPMLSHPQASIRYQAALALSMLSDARVLPRLQAFANTMRQPQWPADISDTSLNAAKAALLSRLDSLGQATSGNSAWQDTQASRPNQTTSNRDTYQAEKLDFPKRKPEAAR